MITAARLALMGAALLTILATALTAFATVRAPLIVYNPTDSVPRGWYSLKLIGDARLPVGSIVLVRLSADVAALADARGYLPRNVPLLKRVGAVAPQLVCIRGQELRIDGQWAATLLAKDGLHRMLRPWTQCRRLVDDELFLLSQTNPASFDSRYFGPVSLGAVVGVAVPLWIFVAP